MLSALVVSVALCAWMATTGTWDLFAAESFGSFYDAHARSLLGPDLLSAPIPISPDSEHALDIVFDPVIREVTVVCDGQEVLHRHPELYPADPGSLTIGVNRVGGSLPERFTGQLREWAPAGWWSSLASAGGTPHSSKR